MRTANADPQAAPRRTFDPWLLPAAALALIPILAILRPGIPNTADGIVHILRTFEASELLRAGVLYPRWAPDFYFGYGYPFFNFYAPGAHLLAAALALTGLGVVRGVVGVQVLALLLYPTGAYLAARGVFVNGLASRTGQTGPTGLTVPHHPPAARSRGRDRAGTSPFVPTNYQNRRFKRLRTTPAGQKSRFGSPKCCPGRRFAAGLSGIEPVRRRQMRFEQLRGHLTRRQTELVGTDGTSPAPTTPGAADAPGVRGGAGATYGDAPMHLAALAAAALYLYAPLRFKELFTQGNLSQLLALGWLPWCAWAVSEATRRGSPRRIALAGAALAGLMYVHQATAFLAYPILGTNFILLSVVARSKRSLATVIAAFALAGLLSVPFWLPAVAEMKFVSFQQMETGMFNVRLNLVPMRELFAPAPLLDDAALNPPQPNTLGLLQAGAVAVGAVWIVFAGTRSKTRSPLHAQLLVRAGVVATCLLLILPLGAPVWDALPLARFIAFPWRLLGPALLFASVVGSAPLLALRGRAAQAVLALVLIAAPLSVATYMFPRPFAAVAEPSLGELARYELEGGAPATASANEYLPRWVTDPRVPDAMARDRLAGVQPERIDGASLPAGASMQVIEAGKLQDTVRLTLPQAAEIRWRRFYFPGWRAWIDGIPAQTAASTQFGLLTVAVPEGTHELRVAFGTTPARTAGTALLAAGLLVALGLVWAGRQSPTPAAMSFGSRGWQGALVLILVLTGLKTVIVEPETRWFRLRSPDGAPPGMAHAVHAQFANGIELLGYSGGDAAVRQGAQVRLRLFWRTVEPLAEDVRPWVHLDAPAGDVTWANRTKLHAGDKPSSDWPPGFYVVDDYVLEIPAGTPPVLATLRSGLIGPDGKGVALIDGSDAATLGKLRVAEARPLRAADVPGGGPAIRFGEKVALLGHNAVWRVQPDGGWALDLTLYWQASGPVSGDFTVFAHVLGSNGSRLAQGDGQPVGGWYPTSAWAPGQVIADIRSIALPAGSQQASVRQVAVGLYDLATGARLPAVDPAGARLLDDQVLIGAGE